MSVVAAGLEGLVVAETSLSSVDGTNGILTFRGYNANDIVNKVSFEEILHLLWYGELPTRTQLDELTGHLSRHRKLSDDVMKVIRALPTKAVSLG